MLDNVSTDRSVRDELDAYSYERQMTQFMAVTRGAKGLSQEDMAKLLKASQSYVSKLESGTDSDLKIGELDRYLDALGKDVVYRIRQKNNTTLDDIKYHAYAIKNNLEEMAELAQPDDGSAERVADASFELLANLAMFVLQAVEKIPLPGMENRRFCRLELGFDPDEEGISIEAEGALKRDCAASP